MKTNQVMTRKMSQFDVLQRTSDGMFNASALLRQWNALFADKKKIIADYASLNSTKEFIKELENEETRFGKSQIIDNDKITTKNVFSFACKEVVAVTAKKDVCGRSNGKDYWMTPLLFIDFAMWLNPAFKVKVLQFVYDELIKCRHFVGDGYPKLTAAIARFPDADYSKVARAMNYVVFNHHENNIRNSATIEQLKELETLQDKIATMIDLGFITSCNGIIEVLRKMYAKKHQIF